MTHVQIEGMYSPLTVVANEDEHLAEVATRMHANDVGSVAVVSGDRLVGILTERDLARAIADGADPGHTPVGDYMTVDPATVTPSTDANEAARIMADAGIRHLPVVSGDDLVGVVSIRDLLVELLWAARSTQP